MQARASRKTTTFYQAILPAAVVCAILAAACFLGAAIVSAGSDSSSQTLAVGVIAVLTIGAVVCFAFELPVIAVVRYAFIFSFFFKGEINFYKLDEIEDPSGFNLSLTLIAAVILLLYDSLVVNDDGEEKIFPAAFSVLLAGLFVCALISVLYSGSTLFGWFSLWSFTTSILIAFVVASHFSQRDRLVQLVVGLAAGILFTGITALSQYALDFPTNLAFFGTGTEKEMLGTQSQALSRVPAFMRTPTEMAWIVSALLPIVIAPLVCRVKIFESWQKLLLPVAAFWGIVGVILSLARGSWISLLIGIALVISCGWYKLSKSERKSYFVSVAVAIVSAMLLLAPFASRIQERLTADDEGSAYIRVPLMETALRMIQDNPLVGVGLNNYRSAMTKYDETADFVSQIFPNPVHNVFAHITAEAGVPAGIIFSLLIFVAFFECFKTMATRDRLLFALALGASAGMLAFVISAVKEPGSLGSVRPPMRTLFLLFGMILAMSRLRRQQIF